MKRRRVSIDKKGNELLMSPNPGITIQEKQKKLKLLLIWTNKF